MAGRGAGGALRPQLHGEPLGAAVGRPWTRTRMPPAAEGGWRGAPCCWGSCCLVCGGLRSVEGAAGSSPRPSVCCAEAAGHVAGALAAGVAAGAGRAHAWSGEWRLGALRAFPPHSQVASLHFGRGSGLTLLQCIITCCCCCLNSRNLTPLHSLPADCVWRRGVGQGQVWERQLARATTGTRQLNYEALDS